MGWNWFPNPKWNLPPLPPTHELYKERYDDMRGRERCDLDLSGSKSKPCCLLFWPQGQWGLVSLLLWARTCGPCWQGRVGVLSAPLPPPRATVICEGSQGCDRLTVPPRTSFLGPWGKPGVICLQSSTCLLLFSHSVVSSSLRTHGLEQIRLLCPLSPGVCSDSCPLSRWCHPTILSSVTPFSSCPQFFLASWSFPTSQLFADGQRIEASASVLPMNIQGWVPFRSTGLSSLKSQGLSKVLCNITI